MHGKPDAFESPPLESEVWSLEFRATDDGRALLLALRRTAPGPCGGELVNACANQSGSGGGSAPRQN